jgi:hypothetical protein
MNPHLFVMVLVWLIAASEASANTVFYSDRNLFDAAIGASITDNYESPGYAGPNGFLQLTDAKMDKVFGETRYTTTGFLNTNIIDDKIFGFNGSHAYCAGCNGSFTLDFTHTTIGNHKGVYGVGFDFVNNGPPYNAFITFGDKSSVDELLPIEFQPNTGFFGVASTSLIASIALGLPDGGATQSGFFAEDNLTIGTSLTAVPLPSTLILFSIGVAGLGFCSRRIERRESSRLFSR